MVETTSAAQACVELLRRENLGVATFMILVLIPCYSVLQKPNPNIYGLYKCLNRGEVISSPVSVKWTNGHLNF